MAIEHWAARFTANGVDPADFTRVTSAIDSWDEWCAAWCRAAAEHEDLGRRALGDGRGLSGGSHLAQAAVYYHFAKFLFVQDLGQMREAHAAAVRCLNDALPYLSPPGERVEIPFDAAPPSGCSWTAAWPPSPSTVPGRERPSTTWRYARTGRRPARPFWTP